MPVPLGDTGKVKAVSLSQAILQIQYQGEEPVFCGLFGKFYYE